MEKGKPKTVQARHKPRAFGPCKPPRFRKSVLVVGAFKSGNQLNEMQRTINKSASDEDAPLAK